MLQWSGFRCFVAYNPSVERISYRIARKDTVYIRQFVGCRAKIRVRVKARVAEG